MAQIKQSQLLVVSGSHLHIPCSFPMQLWDGAFMEHTMTSTQMVQGRPVRWHRMCQPVRLCITEHACSESHNFIFLVVWQMNMWLICSLETLKLDWVISGQIKSNFMKKMLLSCVLLIFLIVAISICLHHFLDHAIGQQSRYLTLLLWLPCMAHQHSSSWWHAILIGQKFSLNYNKHRILWMFLLLSFGYSNENLQ